MELFNQKPIMLFTHSLCNTNTTDIVQNADVKTLRASSDHRTNVQNVPDKTTPHYELNKRFLSMLFLSNVIV